jgi:long-chain acyl-CoA synthetase
MDYKATASCVSRNGSSHRAPGHFSERLRQETADARAALYTAPFIVDALNGDLSRATYLAYLRETYHYVKPTVPLLLFMASRLTSEKDWLQVPWVDHPRLNTGYTDWILNDIGNAGGNPEAVRRSKPCIAVELMNAYNYDMIARRNPVGYFGMLFVFEHLSTTVSNEAAKSIRQSLRLGDDCFTYLASQGDAAIEHAEATGVMIDQIVDPEDQDIIIDASTVMICLFAEMFRALSCGGQIFVPAGF